MSNLFGDAGALTDATIKALPQGFWSSFGYLSHDTMAALPNSLLTVTLASNFGTFVLYTLSCIICMVAFHNHPNYSPLRHLLIPIFGLLANLACMAFYLIGPFMGYGTKMEPLIALGIACGLGHLRRDLLRPLQQIQGPEHVGFARDAPATPFPNEDPWNSNSFRYPIVGASATITRITLVAPSPSLRPRTGRRLAVRPGRRSRRPGYG